MKKRKIFQISIVPLAGLIPLVLFVLLFNPTPAASQEAAHSILENEKARAAVGTAALSHQSGSNSAVAVPSEHPLFVGASAPTVPAYRIEVDTNDVITAFVGVSVWGAAYDDDNDRVLFSDQYDLYEWSVADGTVSFLATVSDTTGTDLPMEGLAYYGGTLYAAKATSEGEGEGIFQIDLTTFQASRTIVYANPAQTTISGIDADPITGQIYGVNDSTSQRGLVQIDPDGTVTLIAPYLGGEVDVDGLAVGDGKAYLITDDTTPRNFNVFDFGVMTYTAVVTNPWTTAENFAGGAWISLKPASFPVCEGFEGGELPSNFYPEVFFSGPASGRVQVTTAFPNTGTYNLDLDTSCPGCGGFTQQSATMVVDLAGQTNVMLDFWVFEHGDENHPQDGIFISDDGGTTWAQIISLNNFPLGYVNVRLDLDEEAASAGMSMVDGFQIRFQSYDNSWIPIDGYSFDDICVEPEVIEISLTKTVGTDPNICAGTDNIYVLPGTNVTYCYAVTNSGNVLFSLHDLDDSALGNLLSGEGINLGSGETFFYTETATINTTTVNTATWTAYNPGPSDIATASDSATVNVIQTTSFPVCEGFEGGVLPGFIYPQVTSSGAANGRVQVTTTITHTGNFNLAIDTDCNNCGGNTQQSAIMAVDLAGQTDVWLDFWVYEHGDENNPEDGVFISADGGLTWAQILSLNNFPSSYQNVELDLVAAAASAGMTMADGFLIRFQSLDNYSIPSDGYSFDDMCVQPGVAEITLNKTVGTNPNTCAITDNIDVYAGTDVTYCYEVTNTGNFILTLHDLVDSELGNVLTGFASDLPPGATGFVTETATISVSTVNSATWTSYNPGPTDVATASDTATVNVLTPPVIAVDPDGIFASQIPDAQTTLPLTISNIGVDTLSWEIFEEIPGRNVAFPESDGIFPRGTSEISFKRAPSTMIGPASSIDKTAIQVVGAEAYGFNLFDDSLYFFPDIDIPDSWSFVGTVASTDFYAGDFVDGFFNQVFAIDNSSQQLYVIDTSTGFSAPIGSTIPNPGQLWSGMSWDSTTDTMFASATDGSTSTLFTISLMDGAATIIGTITGAPGTIDIAVDASGQMYGHDIVLDSLVKIDKATGAATVVGSTGFDANYAQGMDFDEGPDILYLAAYNNALAQGELRIADTSTGNTTLVGTFPSGAEVDALSIIPSEFGCNPGDIPWLSADPISGTVSGGSNQIVDLTFDSTGLGLGVYTGTLCVSSNDHFMPFVTVPITMEVRPPIPDIALNKTVGTEPRVCATTADITAHLNEPVYYCYEVTNTGELTLTLHDLVDDQLGGILSGLAYALGPGQSVNTVAAGLTFSATFTETGVVTNTATWTGYNPGPVDQVSAMATATVNVERYTIYAPMIRKR